MAWRTSTEWGTCHKSRGFLYKLRAPNPLFFGALFWFSETLAPTEWGTCHKSSKASSLQNQGTQPLFFGALLWFSEPLPLQSGEPDMSTHLSRIATWKKENHQKYKDPFCRGMMWKNLGLPVSPENPEMYKNPFCRGNSCSTFPDFVKSI